MRFAITAKQSEAPDATDVERLVRATQTELSGLEGQRLEGAERSRLWRSHWAGVRSLLELLGPGEAKDVQKRAASGRPLTICHGHLTRRYGAVSVHGQPATPGERYYPHGDGCGLVFPDALSARRYPFRFYCDACRKLATSRSRRDETRMRAFASGSEEVVAGFDAGGGEILAWSGECHVCGTTFVSDRPDARRCDVCRSSHR